MGSAECLVKLRDILKILPTGICKLYFTYFNWNAYFANDNANSMLLEFILLFGVHVTQLFMSFTSYSIDKNAAMTFWHEHFPSHPAASPRWTAAWPSAPDTWAATAPPCRSSRRTRSPASAPRRPRRPAAPRRRRGWSCRQVSWVTGRPSVPAPEFPKNLSLSHTHTNRGLAQHQLYWFTRSSSKCLLRRHCKGRGKKSWRCRFSCDTVEEDWTEIHVSCKRTRHARIYLWGQNGCFSICLERFYYKDNKRCLHLKPLYLNMKFLKKRFFAIFK